MLGNTAASIVIRLVFGASLSSYTRFTFSSVSTSMQGVGMSSSPKTRLNISVTTPPRTSLLFLSGPLLYSQPRKRILCSYSLELAEGDNILYVADRREKFVNRFMPVVSGSVEAVEGEPDPVHLCPLQRLLLRIREGVILALGTPRGPVLVPQPREPLLRLVVADRDQVLDLDSLTPVAPRRRNDLLTRLFHRSVRC